MTDQTWTAPLVAVGWQTTADGVSDGFDTRENYRYMTLTVPIPDGVTVHQGTTITITTPEVRP